MVMMITVVSVIMLITLLIMFMVVAAFHVIPPEARDLLPHQHRQGKTDQQRHANRSADVTWHTRGCREAGSSIGVDIVLIARTAWQ